jgi:hypothetical protein
VKSSFVVGLSFLGLVLTGCAGLDVAPVSDDAKASGYRYYQQAPFLFVRSDGKGGLTSEIVFLPDTTHLMSAEPYAYLATNNTTLSFNNGSLTEASVVGDETAVPSAFVDALTKAAAAAIAAADIPTGPQPTAPVPYLFKIIVHGDKIELRGPGAAMGQAGSKASIKVTISAPAGK